MPSGIQESQSNSMLNPSGRVDTDEGSPQTPTTLEPAEQLPDWDEAVEVKSDVILGDEFVNYPEILSNQNNKYTKT